MRDLRQPAAPRLLFAAALAASWALILALGSQLSYLNDDWDFLLLRPGFGAHQILDPHNPHIVVIPILIYKAVLAIFGMGSQQPFRVASTPLFLISVILLFAWLRRRVGDWLALAGVLPILFLGMAGEILLWPFPQIGFCGPMAAGLGAFLALERGDRRGDVLACALLTISVLFGSLGTAFVAGAAVHVAWDRDRWRRAYVAAIPAAVYVAWWLGWGHTAKSGTSLHNLLKSPIYVVEGFASGVSSLLGLPEVGLGGVSVDPGLPLLAGLIALAVIERRRLSGISRWLAVVTVTALGFWFPAALNASEQRAPTEPRYQYMAAIFFVMIAAELLRGVRVGRRALVVVLAIAGLATISNLVFLRQAFDDERLLGEQSRGALAGLEISRGVGRSQVRAQPRQHGRSGSPPDLGRSVLFRDRRLRLPGIFPLRAGGSAGAGARGGGSGDLECPGGWHRPRAGATRRSCAAGDPRPGQRHQPPRKLRFDRASRSWYLRAGAPPRRRDAAAQPGRSHEHADPPLRVPVAAARDSFGWVAVRTEDPSRPLERALAPAAERVGPRPRLRHRLRVGDPRNARYGEPSSFQSG